MEWSFDPPARGDMIRTKLKYYYHYGVYIDDTRIVQFGLPDNTGVDPAAIKVLVTDLETFLNGGRPESARLSREERKKRRPPEETVAYALSKVGTGDYNILHNNCEHFANECLFGEHRSGFLEELRAGIRRKLK